MAKERILGRKWLVNEQNQVEGVDLVKDSKDPDGVLTVERYKELPRSIPDRPFGSFERLPDRRVFVKIRKTGHLVQEETDLTLTNAVIDMWYDYAPLKKSKS